MGNHELYTNCYEVCIPHIQVICLWEIEVQLGQFKGLGGRPGLISGTRFNFRDNSIKFGCLTLLDKVGFELPQLNMSSYVAYPWVTSLLGGIDEDGLWGGKHGEEESVGELYLECTMNKK